jgi:hypothetical protein
LKNPFEDFFTEGFYFDFYLRVLHDLLDLAFDVFSCVILDVERGYGGTGQDYA